MFSEETPKRGAHCPNKNDGTEPSPRAGEAPIRLAYLPSNTIFHGSANPSTETSTEVKMASGCTAPPLECVCVF